MIVLWGSWETIGPFSTRVGLSLGDRGPRKLGSGQSCPKPLASKNDTAQAHTVERE